MAAKTASYEEMTIDELAVLIGEITFVRDTKVAERRRELIAELEALGGLPAPSAAAPKKQGSATAGKPLPPKYRDPDTGAEWSGRGQMAKWLKDRVDAGEPQDKYLVAA